MNIVTFIGSCVVVREFGSQVLIFLSQSIKCCRIELKNTFRTIHLNLRIRVVFHILFEFKCFLKNTVRTGDKRVKTKKQDLELILSKILSH